MAGRASRSGTELGGRSTCTMMFGHVETLAERIEHLDRLRQLAGRDRRLHGVHLLDVPAGPQDGRPSAGRRVRVSRRRRRSPGSTSTTSPNIQSSWVTQGLKVGQLALLFGANDMGSLMIEENVVAAAGTVHHLTLEEIRAGDPRGGLRAAAAERVLRVDRRAFAADPQSDPRELPVLV